MRLVGSLAAIAVFMAVAVACSGGDGDERLFADALPEGWGPIEPVLAEASAYQRAILEDGTLTFEEYERAVLDTVACLRDADVRIVSAPSLQPDGRTLEFTFTGGSSRADAEAAGRVYDTCYAEHLDLVSLVWVFLDPTSERQLANARREFASCLREAGVELPADSTDADFARFYESEPPAAFHRCREHVVQELGLPATWGP